MARAIIDDGYTITTTIPASNRYPAVTIVYRPPTTRELRKMDAAMLGDIDAAVTASVEFIVSHLCSWDITQKDEGETEDKPLPINAKSVEQLEPVLFAVIFNVTRGLHPNGIPMPEAAQETQQGN